MRYEVDGVGDGQRGQRMLPEKGAQGGQVAIAAQDPGRVGHVLSRRSLTCQGEHGRFGIHAHDGTDAARERDGQLPGATANVGRHIVEAQLQRLGQPVDKVGRITSSVLSIERGYLAAEISRHLTTMACPGAC